LLDNASSSSGDESTLFVQIKQQRRTINELSKQLENREAELARQIKLADTLRASADDAHRHAQAERQTASKHEAQLRWHEEQLLLQGEETKRQAMAQQSALRMADRRHQAAIDRMLVRVVQAEDETKVLSARIKDLTQKLDRARALEEQSRCANDQMSRQILDARLATIQASQSSAELVARLNERSVYIGQLENQVRSLLMAASHDYVRLPTALSTPAAFGLEHAAAAADQSLHSEIAKATLQCRDERDSDVPVYELAPLQALAPAADAFRSMELFVMKGHLRHAGKPDEHGLHASHNIAGSTRLLSLCEHGKGDSSAAAAAEDELSAGPESTLYWMAVYAHMVWALYSRLWLRPTMDLAQSMVRAVFGLLALRPWLRLLLLFIPTNWIPAKGSDKAGCS
ncbi:hypothetical protein GGF42_008647, partial [Coemansia sp. RSA 2424]